MNIGTRHPLRKIPNVVYWIKDRNCDALPRLLFDTQVKKLLEDNDASASEIYKEVKDAKPILIEVKNIKDITYPEELEMIIKDKPSRIPRPIFDAGCSSIIFKKKFSYEDTANIIISLLSSDCWGVYIRDEHNFPVRVFFDMRALNNLSEDSDKQYIRNRDNLLIELTNCLKNTHTFVCILGKNNYSDNYFYPNLSDTTFDWIINSFY